MAELRPYPLAALIRRMFRELDEKQSIFDLPARKFHLGDAEHDLSVRFHGHRAATPLGPAAGPQSQMAQNLVLSWLGGSRVVELKTVQVIDDLKIGRPCIDAQTVGYNIEWSQELTVPESLEEYVKGAMLIEILKASGRLDLQDDFGDTLYDLSVGYDLDGIRSEKVQSFLRGMLDARDVIERLRRQIPEEYAEFRDLDFPTRLSDTLTLSTFHGCPPGEIERIVDFLLRENRLHCIVKLNPTLLGEEKARHLLHDVLGYDELSIPDSAFERDTRWAQMIEFVDRLGETADSLELGFGVKFSNTLIVENHRDFFPASEKEMYLSGQPLHVLAMNLVAMFRERFGDRYPISFAAGIDRDNFADAVALGLVPVTVCTDLLRPGGYGRQRTYLESLSRRMNAVGATTIEEFVVRAYGHAEEAQRRGGEGGAAEATSSAAKLLNTRTYVERVTADPRYRKEKNSRVPKKIGSHLELFDCITCDKCVPVCPNGANFTFVIPPAEIPVQKLRRVGDGWESSDEAPIVIEQKHQIGNFADFCNDCGNCDVFCPEDGGPYAVKPRFFGSAEAFRDEKDLDGFHVERNGVSRVVAARFDGREFHLELNEGEGRVRFSSVDFSISFDPDRPGETAEGTAAAEVDLTYFHIMDLIQRAVLGDRETNYVAMQSSD